MTLAFIRRLRRSLLAPAILPAAIALLVIVLIGLFADYQNRVLYQQSRRGEVSAELAIVRAKLEGLVNSNLQLLRGLVAVIESEPDIDQRRFSELASNLLSAETDIRSIAGAPGLVVSLVHPEKMNGRALGLNYNENEQQRDAALQAKETGELVLAGPLDLVQGGRGFVARYPVFARMADDSRRFWGILSAVILTDRLYERSGLLDPGLRIEVALVGQDGTGRQGKQFFGSGAVLQDDPVTAEVRLPSGSWMIAARPKSGWQTVAPNTWLLRAAMIIAAALVVVPMVIGGRLVEERRSHFREIRRREQQLERLSRRLEIALEASKIGVWELDLQSHEMIWDERLNELYEMPDATAERFYEDWTKAVHPEDLAEAEAEFRKALQTGELYSSEYRIVLPDGRIRHLRSRGVVYRTGKGPAKFVGAEWDVTADVELNKALMRAKNLAEQRYGELKAAKARMEHNALHDPLTGLPNRRYLDQMLEGYCGACARAGRGAALLHIDLDRFKQINDTLGHAAGDAMLVHAAHVLRATGRNNDFVARIGGDEFVIVCEPGTELRELHRLAQQIVGQMQRPVPYHGHLCRFGVSVGIATADGTQIDPSQLLVNSDIALYRAKSRGRNRAEFFTSELQEEIVATKRMADEILTGLERNEFLAYYQPQFDARTLELAGVEALARWRHPTRGILTPDVFLKTAEELNVVASIDRLILEQALKDLRQWNFDVERVPRVSVNVSARRLGDEELLGALRELKIKPDTVSFELLESIFLDDDDTLIAWNIEQLKELGIDIEIDDFGTGYASIVSLLKLKPRRLKIDRQLVTPIVESPSQIHLVKSIIEIGKSLGIEVTAEGVETMDHARILRELGCDVLQGYAFAPPMAGDAVAGFIDARRWRAAS